VVDALSPLGITHIDMPVTPKKVPSTPRLGSEASSAAPAVGEASGARRKASASKHRA